MTIAISNSSLNDDNHRPSIRSFFLLAILLNVLKANILSKDIELIKPSITNSIRIPNDSPKIEYIVKNNVSLKENNKSKENSIFAHNSSLSGINIRNKSNYTYSKLENRILHILSGCKIENCDICINKNPDACSICHQGYFLKNQTCSTCPIGCLTCTSKFVCSKCNTSKNYYLDSNYTCSLCQNNCKKCNQYGNCEICDDGYYLLNNSSSIINSASNPICQPCLSNCKKCTYNTSCIACKDYFLLDSINNKCISCINSNCDSCNVDGKCRNCKTGYFLDTNNICSKCTISNCKECSKDGKCKSCETGFFLSHADTLCKKCSEFDEYCISCTADGLCNSCRGPSYLDHSFSNSLSMRTCKRCYSGTYVKEGNLCGLCTDFGKCSECSIEGCSLCMANASPEDNSSCNCDYGYIGLGNACLSLLIFIVPIGLFGILIIIVSYCLIRIKRIKAFNRRHAISHNNNNNLNNNRVNLHINRNNQIDNIVNRNPINTDDNFYINNNRNIPIPLKNRILKPLNHHDKLHDNKCIFGDESPPFWEFDCGGYMCNPCSLKIVTNFTPDRSNCPKCNKPFSSFRYINRFFENEDSISLKDQSVIKIESIKSDSLNNSINDSQADSTCKICFVLKNSKKIKCDSNKPHLLCNYCYNRLINIEEIANCPFCRNDIQR